MEVYQAQPGKKWLYMAKSENHGYKLTKLPFVGKSNTA